MDVNAAAIETSRSGWNGDMDGTVDGSHPWFLLHLCRA